MSAFLYSKSKQERSTYLKRNEFWKRGLPYVGNKGMKAEKIIEALPSGHRFIDVFGGVVQSH